MNDNFDTPRTISYAQSIRRMGYRTAIHALPQEGQDLVDSLLDRGFSNTAITQEINSQYGQHLKDKELLLISNYSVRTYKNNYWMNSPEFSKIISTGNPTIKKKLAQVEDRANQLLLRFNALEQLIEVALKVKALVIDRSSPYEDNNPMGFIDRNRSTARRNYFNMCLKIFHIQLDLGMIQTRHRPTTPETTPIIKKNDEIEDKRSLKEQIEELYNSISNKDKSIGMSDEIAKLEN